MKKLIGTSLVAVLTALPLMAGATVTDTDPGATNSNAPVASNAPKYSLKAANAENDGKVASAGYVKGAYNAAIKAINKTVDKLDDGLGGYDIDANTLKVQGADVATQTGVVNTIKSSTVTTSLNGTATASIQVVDDWATDGLAADPVEVSVDMSNVGANSSVTVDAYHATYTPSGT